MNDIRKLDDFEAFKKLEKAEKKDREDRDAEIAAIQEKKKTLNELFQRADREKEKIILSFSSFEMEINGVGLCLKNNSTGGGTREYSIEEAIFSVSRDPDGELSTIIQAFLDNREELKISVVSF